MTTFPTWLTGPNGERRVFNSADEVPKGWVDGLHKSVRTVAEPPLAEMYVSDFAVMHFEKDGPDDESEDLSAAAKHIGDRLSDDEQDTPRARRKPAKHK